MLEMIVFTHIGNVRLIIWLLQSEVISHLEVYSIIIKVIYLSDNFI